MMTAGHVSNPAGYAGVTLNLARQAIGAAFDTAPHRARQGELRFTMASALPAARILIDQADEADRAALSRLVDQLNQTLTDPTGKVTDGFGHTRPVYAWLALHLMATAAKRCQGTDALLGLTQAAQHLLSTQQDQPDARLVVWQRVVALHLDLPAPASDWPRVDQPTPLAELGKDDLIDAWTYNELVGLHGLHLYALTESRQDLSARAEQASLYHLTHTQPDYTTYQPWALAAFAGNPQTAVFAEQQLHDVATHLSIEGPGGAVLPALLLADAYATLSGRLV